MSNTEEFVCLKINNWKKFNPRKDVKEPSWFRLNHSLMEDEEFYHFSHPEIVAWIYILSAASKKNKDQIRVNFERAERVRKLTKEVILSTVKKLEELRIVAVLVTDASRERDGDDTATNATDGRTDETDGTKRDGTDEKAPPPAPPSAPPENRKSQIPESLRKILPPDPENSLDQKKPTPLRVQVLAQVWVESLRCIGKERLGILANEETEIHRGIKAHGFENCLLALYGFRLQPKDEKFDPAKFASISRIFGRNSKGESKFDWFVNLATEIAANGKDCRSENESQELELDPEEIRRELEENSRRADELRSRG